MHVKLLLMALLLAPLAAGQGPAPGHDATSYAVAYLEAQADDVSADPVGYAKERASANATRAEVEHALYVACWAADDQGVQHEACNGFYTPPGHAAPEQPEAMAQDNTSAFVAEAIAVVNDTVADPASAPSQAKRLVAATKDFLAQVAGSIRDGVDDLLKVVASLDVAVGDAGLGVAQASGDAAAATAKGLSSGSQAATDTLHEAGRAAASASASVGQGVKKAGQAVLDGCQEAGSAVAGAANQAMGTVGQALAKGAQGVTDAAQATGQGIADAAKSVGRAIAAAVGGLLEPSPAAPEPAPEPTLPPLDDGALGGVMDIL